MTERFAISITADGVVGGTPTPEPELKPASQWNLKGGDLIEVREILLDGELDPRVVLALFNSYRCADEGYPLSTECTLSCCTFISFFGTDLTATADKVMVVRKVKLVDAE